ncbi:hypothetical protein [Microvirga pakistanensis]|uniref:hypothetical protein n=1 Tax=Microvirga pakistanensis TaxID=1682650 RepID=UPI00106AF378|nr:hypothetical protein [Microvirga pakistanensis]
MQFESLLTSIRSQLGRPVRVAIDTSCLPKHYILYLIGLSFENSLVSEMQLFYAEGLYSPVHLGANGNEGSNAYRFSMGEWRPLAIPYFEGELALENKSRIVASLGFETLEARKFIRTYQADKYAVILPFPSHSPEYEEIGTRDGEMLARELDVPETEIYHCPAGSASNMARLLDTELKTPKGFSDTLMSLGTKPHAVGMGVHALINKRATVICRVPAQYPENETAATGSSWVFRIQDRSSLDLTLETSAFAELA